VVVFATANPFDEDEHGLFGVVTVRRCVCTAVFVAVFRGGVVAIVVPADTARERCNRGRPRRCEQRSTARRLRVFDVHVCFPHHRYPVLLIKIFDLIFLAIN
jgi:hypothetical protein